MEISFEADLQAKLEQLSIESGRPAIDLVHEAVHGYLKVLADTREMLSCRYDDIKSGRVKLIPGDEVFTRLFEKSEARRTAPRQ